LGGAVPLVWLKKGDIYLQRPSFTLNPVFMVGHIMCRAWHVSDPHMVKEIYKGGFTPPRAYCSTFAPGGKNTCRETDSFICISDRVIKTTG